MERYRMDEVGSLKLLEHLIARVSDEKKDLTPCSLDDDASEDERNEICLNYYFSSVSEES